MNNENNRKELSEKESIEVVNKLYFIHSDFSLGALDDLSISLNLYLNVCRYCVHFMKSKNVPNELILSFLNDIARNNSTALDTLKKSLKEEGLLKD